MFDNKPIVALLLSIGQPLSKVHFTCDLQVVLVLKASVRADSVLLDESL